MTTAARRSGLLFNRLWAALRRACGWPGLAGLALLASAAIYIARVVAFTEPLAPLPVSSALASQRLASSPATGLAILDEADLPGLQRALAARAATAGLGWPAADYRLLPAGTSLPPVYEVHCTLKGNYPSIRRFIVDTLRGPPSASLREFSLTRATSDSADVEAHLTFAFFLTPDSNPAITIADAPTSAPGARP